MPQRPHPDEKSGGYELRRVPGWRPALDLALRDLRRRGRNRRARALPPRLYADAPRPLAGEGAPSARRPSARGAPPPECDARQQGELDRPSAQEEGRWDRAARRPLAEER